MEYTVNGLARLAGVSVRTLHWYDEIGLLRPARVTEVGYRMYARMRWMRCRASCSTGRLACRSNRSAR